VAEGQWPWELDGKRFMAGGVGAGAADARFIQQHWQVIRQPPYDTPPYSAPEVSTFLSIVICSNLFSS
jgi:hypothetical protein